MSTRIQVPKSELQHFHTLKSLSIDQLQKISDAMESTEGALLGSEDIERRLAQVLEDEAKRKSVAHLIFMLYQLRHLEDLSAGALVDSLTVSLKAQAQSLGWDKDDFTVWEASYSPSLEALLSISRLETASKALELAYEGSRVVARSRVVTDIRPVFNAEDDMAEMLVLHNLIVDYLDQVGGKTEEISLQISEKDLRRLSRHCERALEKSQKAKSKLEESCGIPVTILGEEEGD